MAVDKKSLINWVGGKRLLRETIAPLIPTDIVSYIEPFGGAGWVLFYKEKWAELEVYNDLDGRLVNLFRIVKYHPESLKKELKYLLGSREIFMQFLNTEGVTDIQKATSFFYVITRSFGGKGKNYATARKSSGGACKSCSNQLLKIDAIHKRLDKVLIENKDFEKLIKQYDHAGAFFFCDPPYTSGAGYETISCENFEHERLRATLGNIKGRFLLSYDDSVQIRELYKDYKIIEVERQKGINKKDCKNNIYKELLITNYLT